MTKPTFKLLIGPSIIAFAITAMYAISIDTSELNRADVAFGLMLLLAMTNAYFAYRWFEKGFDTWRLMKQQEEVASSIIKKLMKKFAPTEKPETIIENILAEQVSDVVKDLKNIIDKHKS